MNQVKTFFQNRLGPDVLHWCMLIAVEDPELNSVMFDIIVDIWREKTMISFRSINSAFNVFECVFNIMLCYHIKMYHIMVNKYWHLVATKYNPQWYLAHIQFYVLRCYILVSQFFTFYGLYQKLRTNACCRVRPLSLHDYAYRIYSRIS